MQQKSKIKNRQGAREGPTRWVLLPGIHGYQIHHVPTSGQGDRAFFLFYRSKRKRNKFHPSLPGHLLSKRGGGRRATQPLWGLPGAQLSYFWSWWGVRRVPWAWGLEPKKDWFKFTLFLLSRRGQAFLVIKIGLLFPIGGGRGTFLGLNSPISGPGEGWGGYLGLEGWNQKRTDLNSPSLSFQGEGRPSSSLK